MVFRNGEQDCDGKYFEAEKEEMEDCVKLCLEQPRVVVEAPEVFFVVDPLGMTVPTMKREECKAKRRKVNRQEKRSREDDRMERSQRAAAAGKEGKSTPLRFFAFSPYSGYATEWRCFLCSLAFPCRCNGPRVDLYTFG